MKLVHPEWAEFFEENQKLLDRILKRVSISCTPEPEKIFTFARCGVSDRKVIILGQDPYPQPGIATGRAFEVGTLQSWSKPFRQISLRNIMRAVYHVYTPNMEILSFQEIKRKIEAGDFPILPPNQLFEDWERQGVLLLNTALTCKPGKPGSHAALWEPFTPKLLSFVKRRTPQAVWFIWGSHAARYLPLITGKTYCSRHPMMCSEQYEDDFLKNPCFLETADRIYWAGAPK